jgi:hypothetical protein
METPDPVLSAIAITAILILITLVVIARQLWLGLYGSRVTQSIEEAVKNLGTATRHYTEVQAVLALTEQFQNRPDLAAKLNEYSRQTVAAALMVRINGVASDIKTVQSELTHHRMMLAKGHNSFQTNVNRAEQMLQRLQQELESLYELNRRFGTTLTSVN